MHELPGLRLSLRGLRETARKRQLRLTSAISRLSDMGRTSPRTPPRNRREIVNQRKEERAKRAREKMARRQKRPSYR